MRTVKKAMLVIGCVMLFQSMSWATTSVSQFGITWTFDGDYEVGQFANDDYWVVGNPNVIIISIDPRSYDDNGHIKNGSMINPSPGNGSVGYDNKGSYAHGMYDHSLNVAFEVNNTNPLIITPNSSLISTISYDEEDQWPQLKTAAILTVLSNTPPENSFRPAYCGDDKTIRFNELDLDYSILSELLSVASAPSLAALERMVERPWLDHGKSVYFGRFQPGDNMASYGRDIADEAGQVSLGLHLDWGADNNALKKTLYVRFVQVGIDLYGAAKNGMNWPGLGAIFCGRKWPILFAGLALNENSDDPWASEMANIGYVSDADFQEDLDTHYTDESHIYSKPYPVNPARLDLVVESGSVTITAGDPYNVHGVDTTWSSTEWAKVLPDYWFCVLDDSRTNDPEGHCYQIGTVDYDNQTLTLKVPFSNNDPKAYEDAPKTEVSYKISVTLVVGHGAPGKLPQSLGADYKEFAPTDLGLPMWYLERLIPPVHIGAGPEITKIYEPTNAGAWQGFVLAALITPGARAAWNHEELFDYEDRFMEEALEIWGEGHYARGWSDFCEDMWDEYRADYGSIWTPGNPQSPIARIVANPTSGESPLFVNFDASSSYDSDGNIEHYEWDFENDATLDAHGITTSHTYNNEGTYTVKLTVRDNQLLTGTVTIEIRVNGESIGPEPHADVPDTTSLQLSNNIIKKSGNTSVTIQCSLKEAGNLSVKIYDAKGREIITLCNEHKDAGIYTFNWTGKDTDANIVGSGIYIVFMESAGYEETRKIAVIK